MNIEEIIQTYGYWAVFLGACVEGESVILTAGVLAHKGYLSLPKIMVVAFLGTLLADQASYWMGRRYGMSLLDQRPQWRARVSKAIDLLHRYDTLYILSFRFIYGIRIISPLIIGASGIDPRRFTLLNFISAFIWAVVSCGAGYLFGGVIDPLWEFICTYPYAVGASVLLLLLGLGLYLYRRSRRPQTP